jgi:hypothetical protein
MTTRTWNPVPRMLTDHLWLAVFCWLGFLAVIAAIATAISIFSDLDASVWEDATQIPRWYGFVMGIHLGTHLLPLNIAYGRTRKDFAKEGAIFVLGLSLMMAILIAIGFILEKLLYDAAGWTHDLSDRHLFSTPYQLHLVLVEYWSIFGVWVALASFIGAVFYRFDWNGMILLIPAAIPISLAEMAIGSTWGPMQVVVDRLSVEPPSSAWASAAIAIAAFGVLLAMCWPVVRDIPVKRRSS